MDSKLRDYQQEAIGRVAAEIERCGKACVQLAAGTGKSVVITGLIQAFSNACRILVLVDNLPYAEGIYHRINEQFSSGYVEILRGGKKLDKAAGINVVVCTLKRAENAADLIGEFDFIIVDSIRSNAKARDLYSLMERPGKNLKLALVSDFLNRDDLEFFGDPVFEYSQTSAIENGFLLPVEFVSGPKADLRILGNLEYVSELLETFFKSFISDPGRRAVFVCSSIREAELVYESFVMLSKAIECVLIHSQADDFNSGLQEFRHYERYRVAITVDMFSLLSAPTVTDIVLLRKISSPSLFDKVLSVVNRHYHEKDIGRIWDFADNRPHFESSMGELVFDNRQIDSREHHPEDIYLGESKENSQGKESSNKGSQKKLSNPCSDKPSKLDLLGRSGLVSILKGVIDRESRKHIIVALFGRWGSGKSSVIEMLSERYKDSPNSNVIIFNAWQAEHSNSMSASIAARLIDQLYESKGLVEQLFLSFKARLLSSKVDLIREAVLVFLLVAFALGYLIPEFVGKIDPDASVVLTSSVFLSVFISLVKSYFKHPFTGKIRELSKRPDFNTHIGLGYSIREQLSSLLLVYPKGVKNIWCSIFGGSDESDHSYILIVDDLDRCSDDKIIETLEAIQLIVDLPGVSVILAVDHQILIEAVAARYRKQRNYLLRPESLSLARDYLGKILQVTITIDRPSAASRDKFIHDRLYEGVAGSEHKGDVFATSSDVLTTNLEVSDFDVTDFSGFVDDFYDDYERSADYLVSSYEECTSFKHCANVFEVYNPRTLIRIHNVITLIKGLYPEVEDSENLLGKYIYLAFWYEVYSVVSVKERGRMRSELINDDAIDDYSSPVYKIAKNLDFYSMSKNEIKKCLYRIKNMSLPSPDSREIELVDAG